MGIRMDVCKADGKPFEDIDLPVTKLYGYYVYGKIAKSANFLISKGYKNIEKIDDDALELLQLYYQKDANAKELTDMIFQTAEVIINADDFDEFARLYDEDMHENWGQERGLFYNHPGVQELIKKIKNKEVTQIMLDWG